MNDWPRPNEMAQAAVGILKDRLADLNRSEVTLSREEAALCLGLISGLAELLDKDTGGGSFGR